MKTMFGQVGTASARARRPFDDRTPRNDSSWTPSTTSSRSRAGTRCGTAGGRHRAAGRRWGSCV